MSHVEPSWPHLGPSWGYLGDMLGPSWASLCHLGALLGHLGATLGPPGGSWGSPWGPLGPSCGPAGPPWNNLKPSWGQSVVLASIVGPSVPLSQPYLRHLEAFWEPSWGHLGLLDHHFGTWFWYAGQIVVPFFGVLTYRDCLSFSCPPIHQHIMASRPQALEEPRRGREALTIQACASFKSGDTM